MFEKRTAEAVRSLTVVVIVLGLGFLAAIGLSVYGLVRIGSDEHATCQIQSRGLKSTPYLVSSLDNLHQILILPPTRQSQHNESLMPKAELAHELALLHSLDMNLAMYVDISARQPRGRTC